MPDTIIAVRSCAGGHLVPDADITGMVRNEDSSVSVYCTEHEPELMAHTREAMGQLALQM